MLLPLARIFHRLTGQAHDGPAITLLRLLAVLNGHGEAMSPRWRHGTLEACMAGKDACPTSSGARLVLTGLSFTLPRHPMRNAGLDGSEPGPWLDWLFRIRFQTGVEMSLDAASLGARATPGTEAPCSGGEKCRLAPRPSRRLFGTVRGGAGKLD